MPREGRAWYDAGMYIQDQLQEIKANIAAAEKRAGREPGSVKLLAVSKTFPVEDIMQAYADGQRLFGENRLQEAMGKMPEMPADCEWHLIGPLQRNKVRKALEQGADAKRIEQRITIPKDTPKGTRIEDIIKE